MENALENGPSMVKSGVLTDRQIKKVENFFTREIIDSNAIPTEVFL